MAATNYYVGLMHYPVYNKHKQIVTTSITNMDVHDISRVCCTYGIAKYILINPLQSQKQLYTKIINFWQNKGKAYQPDRAEALNKITFAHSYEEACEYLKNQEKACPVVVTTSANRREKNIQYDYFHTEHDDGSPVFVLFGTGYGLAEEIHQKADYALEPIESHSAYNHLSVRSAVAIVLDRLIPKNK